VEEVVRFLSFYEVGVIYVHDGEESVEVAMHLVSFWSLREGDSLEVEQLKKMCKYVEGFVEVASYYSVVTSLDVGRNLLDNLLGENFKFYSCIVDVEANNCEGGSGGNMLNYNDDTMIIK
jgi:hypothetical protein